MGTSFMTMPMRMCDELTRMEYHVGRIFRGGCSVAIVKNGVSKLVYMNST